MTHPETCVGMDIGGTHFTAGIVEQENDQLILTHTIEKQINSEGSLDLIVDSLVNEIDNLLAYGKGKQLKRLALSFPGPFLYERGISRISSLHKYEQLFGADLRETLSNRLNGRFSIPRPFFMNDAQAFLLGAVNEYGWQSEKVLGLTLGTGLGSAFYDGDQISEGPRVPNEGFIYNIPYKDGIAEDYISARWIIKRYREISGKEISDVKMICSFPDAGQVFRELGEHMAAVLLPVIRTFKPGKMVFGGKIFQAFHLFGEAFTNGISDHSALEYKICSDTSCLAIKGAVTGSLKAEESDGEQITRKTAQALLPLSKEGKEEGYDIFPACKIENDKINTGFDSLAKWMGRFSNVMIDGYSGVYWENFVTQLNQVFQLADIPVNWFCIDAALKEEQEIELLTAPFLGGDDPVFGRKFSGELADFFEEDKVDKIKPGGAGLNILYGSGAALAGWDGPVVFLDVPKNEIQYRSRTGKISNIGKSASLPSKLQYKRCYFVDWVAMNKHKKAMLPRISVLVDEQRITDITWMEGNDLREALKYMSENVFRARPWFESGAWGGNWIKEHIRGLPADVPNYAWSFELITPENGIILESSGKMLEISFDLLMYHDNKAILGEAASRFGDEFPIRFDFLDTYEGGNLSMQCHPGNSYIRQHFGENFTQDETYYILDAETDARVYLGFREDIAPAEFRKELETSARENKKLEMEDYVQVFPAAKHDLFLIPNRTIHCSGINNMVLEISSTPYIYTFKMYDWLRLDLDGKPRPLNIERAFENLDFERKGARVREELISVPELAEKGADWQLLELPTHPEHFYRIQRLEFRSEVTLETAGQAHILNLVEGGPIQVKTKGATYTIQYAETFLIPSAAKSYELINRGNGEAKVVRAFVKSEPMPY